MRRLNFIVDYDMRVGYCIEDFIKLLVHET